MPKVDYAKELNDLIEIVIQETASDIHFSVGSNPLIRVTGSLIPLLKKPVLTNEDVVSFLDVMLNDQQMADFVSKKRARLFFCA